MQLWSRWHVDFACRTRQRLKLKFCGMQPAELRSLAWKVACLNHKVCSLGAQRVDTGWEVWVQHDTSPLHVIVWVSWKVCKTLVEIEAAKAKCEVKMVQLLGCLVCSPAVIVWGDIGRLFISTFCCPGDLIDKGQPENRRRACSYCGAWRRGEKEKGSRKTQDLGVGCVGRMRFTCIYLGWQYHMQW